MDSQILRAWLHARRAAVRVLGPMLQRLGLGVKKHWRNDPSAIKCVHCGARFAVQDLPYSVNSKSLPQELSSAWVQLVHDEASDTFLREGFELSTLRVRLLSIACTWLRQSGWSLTDSNAVLGRGKLFVLSSAQAATLLNRPGGVLVDVGAGAGHVTTELAPLFDKVVATEASQPMVRRLKGHGFAVHSGVSLDGLRESAQTQGVDLGDGASVVSILNVLDRCDSPSDLLRHAMRLVKPGGQLLLAVVLPFRPHVEEGHRNRPPLESLGLPRDASFEKSAELLWQRLLAPLGLVLEQFARVPYLSQGDHYCRMYALEDSIWVLRKGDEKLAAL